MIVTARLARAGALLVALGFLGLYLSTLTEVHTFDALSYVTSVERKPWIELFHPHHLAYGPLGALALRGSVLLGLGGGAALAMQLVNALAGALGVGLFYRLVLQLLGRSDLALLAAVLLGGSYAYWYYAVEIEVYTVATLFLVLCLMLMVRPVGGLWQMVMLGLAHAGAVLFHQTNVLFGLVVLTWYVLAIHGTPGWSRWRGLLVYLAVLGLAVALPYLWVGFGVSQFRSSEAMLAWLTEYARTGWWGGPLTGQKLLDLRDGLSETLSDGPGGWIGLALIGTTLLVRAGVLATSPHVPAKRWPGGITAALLVWLVVYGGFFFWWEPDNIEFWIASLPPALLLLMHALQSTRPWGWLVCGLLALAGFMLGTNQAVIEQRGNAAHDLQRVIARSLAERSTPADLLIIPDGLQELYLPYYQQRENFISLNQAMFDVNGDWNAACQRIHERIEVARAAGATALIANEALQPPAELLTRHTFSQAQVTACFAPYQPELIDLALAAPVPAYWRLPSAQELAATTGWQFAASALGWQSMNLGDQRIEQGWWFVPGVDPSITSPLLRIEAGRLQAIEVDLENGTQRRDLQVFLIGADGLTSEARSRQAELAAGPALQTVRVPVADLAATEPVVRLRIDPVGVGDGGAIRIVAVRLVLTR